MSEEISLTHPSLFTARFKRKGLPVLPGIFMTVMLDMLAFGMFLPDVQLRAKSLGLSSFGLGLTLAMYSIAQVISSPILGRMSDNLGRRPVLIVTSLLSTVSYLLYTQSGNQGGAGLIFLFLSRIMLGTAAANLGVAFAYVADVTSPENRGKGMGLLGAAFGIGFVLGPAIGGLLLGVGKGSPILLGLVGATFTFLNFLYIFFFLPEPIRLERKKNTESSINLFKRAFSTPAVASLLWMFAALNLGFTAMESTFFLLLNSNHRGFGLDANHARIVGSLILATVGLVSVVMQGYFSRVLSKKFGEISVLKFAYIGLAFVFLAIPFEPLYFPQFIGAILIAVCSGAAQPNSQSLLSRRAPSDLQGGIFGVTQGIGGFARLIGPIVSNGLFAWHYYSPYMLGAALIGLGAVLARNIKPIDGDVLAAEVA